MNISEGKIVSLVYKLNLNDRKGDLIETIEKEKPLEFLYGAGFLLPLFEQNISGLTKDQSFSFPLKSENAYGSIREEMVVDIPSKSFEVNGKMDDSMIQIGKSIPMRDQSGNRMTGRITQVDNEFVTMDFNHPLAGQDLFFEGEVIGVREPTEEELNDLHAHNHGGCGCGSGDSCGDGSCEDGCGCDSDATSQHNEHSGCGCGH